ncbi:MAG: hypothetical protein WDN66_00345 [Candidatus Saccharibacteria bacterium]
MNEKTRKKLEEAHQIHTDYNWPKQNWRAWGSWFSWGSPVV